MRLSFYPVLIVATSALNSISLASAKDLIQIDNGFPASVVNLRDGDNMTRYLKGAQHEVDALPEGGDEERGWQSALENLKDVDTLKNADKIKSEDAAKWQSAAEKLQAGGKFKTEGAEKARWQNALSKLKAEGKLDEAGEEKVTKITEEAAQELEKNPKKWRYVKKALEITFGAALTSFIVAGIYASITSAE